MIDRGTDVNVIRAKRDAALSALVSGIPYAQFLGISFDRRGDELTGILHFSDKLIGNPLLPALHGGVTAAFLEMTAITELTWSLVWPMVEDGRFDPETPPGQRMGHFMQS